MKYLSLFKQVATKNILVDAGFKPPEGIIFSAATCDCVTGSKKFTPRSLATFIPLYDKDLLSYEEKKFEQRYSNLDTCLKKTKTDLEKLKTEIMQKEKWEERLEIIHKILFPFQKLFIETLNELAVLLNFKAKVGGAKKRSEPTSKEVDKIDTVYTTLFISSLKPLIEKMLPQSLLDCKENYTDDLGIDAFEQGFWADIFWYLPENPRYPCDMTVETVAQVAIDSHAGISKTIGLRHRMEDSVLCSENIVAVFDGHKGNEVSLRLAEAFHEKLKESPYPSKDRLNKVAAEINAEFHPSLKAGSTAILMTKTENGHLRFSNCGDCRAIIAGALKTPYRVSYDHTAAEKREVERLQLNRVPITKHIGQITGNDRTLITRIDHGYEPSRHFGSDQTHTPFTFDIVDRKLEKDDKLVILASDGLWGVMSDFEVGNMAMSLFNNGKRPEEISDHLVKEAFALDSGDNISVIVWEIA